MRFLRGISRSAGLAALAMTSVFALAVSLCQGQIPKPAPKKLSLPGGRPFPASQADLLSMRDRADKQAVKKMRAHAWDLFAGLTRGKDPIWNSWYTKCDLGLLGCNDIPAAVPGSANQLLDSFEVPVQFLEQFLNTAVLQPQGQSIQAFDAEGKSRLRKFLEDQGVHPQFAAVLFNQDAEVHIIKDCLHQLPAKIGNVTFDPCIPKLETPGKIEDFGPGSVLLKTTWEYVPNEGGPLFTYDSCVWKSISDANCRQTYAPSFEVGKDSEKVQCRPRGNRVPLSCFYYIRLSRPEADWANRYFTRAVLATGSSVTVKEGDYLVLMGVHLTTKETPDWVWATFWWDAHAASDPKAAGRPPSIRGKWRNFLMDTTLSANTPIETDKGPKICFNPYLELQLPHDGNISNCLQCHSKAAYVPAPGKADTANPYNEGILARDGRKLASGGYPDSCYFGGRVSTDFLWTVAKALDPQSQEHMFRLGVAIKELQEEQRLNRIEKPPAEPK